MKCPFCNKEIPDGSAYCNHCGSVVPHVAVQKDPSTDEPITTDFDSSEEKINRQIKAPIFSFLLTISLIAIAVWFVDKTIINNEFSDSSDDSIASSYDESKDTDNDEAIPTFISDEEDSDVIANYETILTNGYYEAAVTLPVGLYNIEQIYGHGDVYYQGQLLAVFGPSSNPLYVSSYDNLMILDDSPLVIRGNVVLKLSTTRALKVRKKKKNPAKKNYHFSNGTYKCGKDFPKGTYDLILKYKSDYGIVEIPNKLNEMVTEEGIARANNITLKKGDELTLIDCSVRLAPSHLKFSKNTYDGKDTSNTDDDSNTPDNDGSIYEPDKVDSYIEKKTKNVKKNSTEMVDAIGFLAKDDAKKASKAKINTAIAFIRDLYPNYHKNDSVMLKTMYYGYLLEYSFDFTDPRSALGHDAEQVVRYVYRGYDSIDDDSTKSNLEQIKKDLSKIN